MRGPGTPTLDQLQVLLAVIDEGGLTAAARQLGRATSAISYAIDQLELQLGVTLFERGKRRTPALTAAGMAVAVEARAINGDVEALRAKVAGMLAGLEPEVTMAVDVMLPTARLVDVLQGFQREFPTVSLRLQCRGTWGGHRYGVARSRLDRRDRPGPRLRHRADHGRRRRRGDHSSRGTRPTRSPDVH